MSSANDPSDPLYIHHTDTIGLVLVSKPLDGTNYLSGRRSMMLALEGQNKLGFVDCTIRKPDTTDVVKHRLWSRHDFPSKEISVSVIYNTSASSIWNYLEKRFNIKNGPRIFQLKNNLSSCVQGNDSLTNYYTHFKSIEAELGELCVVHNCVCTGVDPFLQSAKEECNIPKFRG